MSKRELAEIEYLVDRCNKLQGAADVASQPVTRLWLLERIGILRAGIDAMRGASSRTC